MQPKTKQQKEVMELYKKLPELTSLEIEDARKKVALHIAKKDAKGNYYCLDCGHSWKGNEDNKIVCPHCKAKLKLNTDKWRVWNDRYYLMNITAIGGYQVLRMFYVRAKYQKNNKPQIELAETFQRWIDLKGKIQIVGLKRASVGWYVDRWCWDAGFEIRSKHYVHDIIPWNVFGKIKCLPELKRNGFKGKFHNCNPADLITALISDNRIETLWKMKQYELVHFALRNHDFLFNYWKSLKITFRHRYKIEDISLWKDYISTMKELGKDILNPTLICPQNLKEAHDSLQPLLRTHREKERIRREKEAFYNQQKEREAKEEAYKKAKERYFGLAFSDGEILISPLKSVEDFFIEGTEQKHCVYSNRYYLKNDSLIFHATSNGNILATIEFSLNDMTILQCRGKCNSVPEHKDRIENLIINNIGQIQQCKMAS